LLYNICNYSVASGLEIESEKIVQEALDNAQENQTSITIADP